MPEYYTLSEGITALRKEGYTEDFNLDEHYLVCRVGNIYPDEFVIDKVYRYEGESNPDDEAALYAISSEKHGVKGILVDGYGTSSAKASSALLAKLGERK